MLSSRGGRIAVNLDEITKITHSFTTTSSRENFKFKIPVHPLYTCSGTRLVCDRAYIVGRISLIRVRLGEMMLGSVSLDEIAGFISNPAIIHQT